MRRTILPLITSFVLLFPFVLSAPARADMSPTVSRSAGSFFAAATACERNGKIRKDTANELVAKLDRYLTTRNRKWMRQGFKEGERRSSVLVVGKGWTHIDTDDAACQRIQGVLDDYASQLEGD